MALSQLDIERLAAMARTEALWESLRETPNRVHLTPAQEQEIDRRVAEYREEGQPGRPWREALDEIRSAQGGVLG